MNYRMMGRFVAQILAIEAVFMLPAMMISIYDRDERAIFGFAATIGVVFLVVAVLSAVTRRTRRGFYDAFHASLPF